MFQVMRSAIVIPRALFGDVAIRTAADVLRMATIGGARCLGLDHAIGSLEQGKKADVILVDLRKAWCQPVRTENLIANLVYNANGGDVTHVFVDGELLVREGRLTRFDEMELFAEAQAVAEDVWARAKYLFEREGMP
jgi:5-methylthioadenosine/S-adenosylhomocysteine deaminase